MSSMERFTQRARRVLSLAHQEAESSAEGEVEQDESSDSDSEK